MSTEHVTHIIVLLLPPKLSLEGYLSASLGGGGTHRSKNVSFESRKGMWVLRFLPRALMQFPNAESDWLIFFACLVIWELQEHSDLFESLTLRVCPRNALRSSKIAEADPRFFHEAALVHLSR